MFESINEIAVLVSAILALAIGSIWYSPLLFGKHWMRAVGRTEADLEASKHKMPRMVFFALLANLLALYVIAQFVALGADSPVSMSTLGLMLALMHGAFLSSAVIWEERPIAYLLINAGYAAVVIFTGIAVIGYWPW